MRRQEANGDECKLTLPFKINALRMLMTGKAKEYFDLWEAHREPTDAAKSYEELLHKVKDHARKRRLGTSVHKTMQRGGDPMDAGEVQDWHRHHICGGEWEEYEIGAIGYYKGKGKGEQRQRERLFKLRVSLAFRQGVFLSTQRQRRKRRQGQRQRISRSVFQLWRVRASR